MKPPAPFFFLALMTGCGASPASPGPSDAAPEATPDAAQAHETGSPAPDAGAPFDAGNACDHLKETVDEASSLARACDPASSTCGAVVDGLCCPITVDSANGGAVNDFQEAVKNYKAKCKPDCTKILCGANPPPSNLCDNAGRICR